MRIVLSPFDRPATRRVFSWRPRRLSASSLSTIPVPYTSLRRAERNACSAGETVPDVATAKRWRLARTTLSSILTTGTNDLSMLSRISLDEAESRRIGMSAGAVSSGYFQGWLSSYVND